MKKLLLLFVFFPLFSYAQLTSGVYNIVKHISVVDNEEMFGTDKMLGTSFFIVDIEHSLISFTASDYVVAIYEITETVKTEETVLYICKEKKSGRTLRLMFQPNKKVEDAGELLVSQSDNWIDFFTLLKIEQ